MRYGRPWLLLLIWSVVMLLTARAVCGDAFDMHFFFLVFSCFGGPATAWAHDANGLRTDQTFAININSTNAICRFPLLGLYACVAKTFSMLLAVYFFFTFSVFVVDDDITNQRMPRVDPHPVCPAWSLQVRKFYNLIVLCVRLDAALWFPVSRCCVSCPFLSD